MLPGTGVAPETLSSGRETSVPQLAFCFLLNSGFISTVFCLVFFGVFCGPAGEVFFFFFTPRLIRCAQVLSSSVRRRQKNVNQAPINPSNVW